MESSNVVSHTIILAIAFFVVVPIAVAILQTNQKLQVWGIFAAMALLIFSPSLQLNYLADASYVKGTTQAYEISYLDIFALLYFVLMLLKQDYKFKFFIGGTFFFLLYLIACSISYVNAPSKIYWAFEMFRLVKMWFFIVVMCNIVICYNCFSTILTGLALGVILNFFDTLFQKYGLGRYASIGFMKHKNSAGMYFNMIMPLCLYIAVNLKLEPKWRNWFYAFMFVVCAASCVFTISRGAWAIFALEMLGILAISCFRGMNRKKINIMLGVILIMILGLFKSYDTLYQRITVGNTAGTEGRKDLIINAKDMADKNFWGVGFNNYSEANNYENNYGDIYSKLKNVGTDRNLGKVETVYMLTAAEIGWIGLATMLLWYFYYLYESFRCSLYFWKTNFIYMPFGIFVALCGAYLHSTLEWSLRYSQNFYLLALYFAIISALVYFVNTDILNKRRH